MGIDDIAKDTLKGAILHQYDDQMNLFVTHVQFIGEPYSPPASALSQTVPIQATTAQAIRIKASRVKQIKVGITGGSATGKKLKSLDGKVVGGVDESITVPLVDGEVEIVVEASSTGTVTLDLDGSVDPIAAGLNTTDTATITFS